MGQDIWNVPGSGDEMGHQGVVDNKVSEHQFGGSPNHNAIVGPVGKRISNGR